MKWHLRLAAGAGVLFILAALCANAQETKQDKKELKEDKAPPNYYPLQVGNTWHYRITVQGNTANAVSSIAKVETIDGVPLARLEATVNGKVVSVEHLSVTDKGVFRHRNNGQEITPPICLLKFPVKAGSKWDGDIAVGKEKGKYFCEAAEESVTVAAGKFKTLRVAIRLESEENGNKKTVQTTYWFAQNVGFVKQTVEAGNLNVSGELEKFEAAKNKK